MKVLNCLKNVYLEIIPPAVQKGHNVTLLCHYDMEGAPLYSVKWYRGKHEFYRYTPSDSPQSKVFPLHGISVDRSPNNTVVAATLRARNKSQGHDCDVACCPRDKP
ncbi:hypothetical protein M8J76_016052 [Diaphorina citri]|nr:hypothetical protein M8J76_016052 [Diaphorina citri]